MSEDAELAYRSTCTPEARQRLSERAHDIARRRQTTPTNADLPTTTGWRIANRPKLKGRSDNEWYMDSYVAVLGKDGQLYQGLHEQREYSYNYRLNTDTTTYHVMTADDYEAWDARFTCSQPPESGLWSRGIGYYYPSHTERLQRALTSFDEQDHARQIAATRQAASASEEAARRERMKDVYAAARRRAGYGAALWVATAIILLLAGRGDIHHHGVPSGSYVTTAVALIASIAAGIAIDMQWGPQKNSWYVIGFLIGAYSFVQHDHRFWANYMSPPVNLTAPLVMWLLAPVLGVLGYSARAFVARTVKGR